MVAGTTNIRLLIPLARGSLPSGAVLTDARSALTTLREAVESGSADADLRRHGIAVLTVFGSVLDDACDEPGDLDVAVLPERDRRIDVLEVIGWLTDLAGGFDRIDLAVLTGENPVLDAQALCGLPLYESEPNRWATAQMAALGICWDTQKFRDLELARLAGTLP